LQQRFTLVLHGARPNDGFAAGPPSARQDNPDAQVRNGLRFVKQIHLQPIVDHQTADGAAL
jgi:hypothetical protein